MSIGRTEFIVTLYGFISIVYKFFEVKSSIIVPIQPPADIDMAVD